MGLKPGMLVLDVGCGIGGPARAIARFSDVNIVGINNNEFQIGRAKMHAKRAGLQNQLKFVEGDFMKLSQQFGENSFDAGMFVPYARCMMIDADVWVFLVYAIEATVHAPTWERVYSEILKVLKPGGVVRCFLSLQ